MEQKNSNGRKYRNLRAAVVLFTLFGIGLFLYFVSQIGVNEILVNIGKISLPAFGFVLFIHLSRLFCRALAWKLSVPGPHKLSVFDTLKAVFIGEALSSMLPLGIVVSGTAKAVTVSNRVPLSIGFASVATENLFYSLSTSLLIIFGASAMLYSSPIPADWTWIIDLLIALSALALLLGILTVIRQWHWVSGLAEWIYQRGFLKNILHQGRVEIRQVEDKIYGFYRRYPQRFFPIFLLEVSFHALGVFEVWFILRRISETAPDVYSCFLFETVSRAVTVFFKLVPFVIGVDEAGAQLVAEAVTVSAGVAVTLAIIRKGKLLFWSTMGMFFLAKRGLGLADIRNHAERIIAADQEAAK
jgi:hypothetical protein